MSIAANFYPDVFPLPLHFPDSPLEKQIWSLSSIFLVQLPLKPTLSLLQTGCLSDCLCRASGIQTWVWLQKDVYSSRSFQVVLMHRQVWQPLDKYQLNAIAQDVPDIYQTNRHTEESILVTLMLRKNTALWEKDNRHLQLYQWLCGFNRSFGKKVVYYKETGPYRSPGWEAMGWNKN